MPGICCRICINLSNLVWDDVLFLTKVYLSLRHSLEGVSSQQQGSNRFYCVQRCPVSVCCRLVDCAVKGSQRPIIYTYSTSCFLRSGVPSASATLEMASKTFKHEFVTCRAIIQLWWKMPNKLKFQDLGLG